MKLKRLKLAEVQTEYAALSYSEQSEILGGFTQADFKYMMDNGIWQGGNVDGMGYVTKDGDVQLGGITVYGSLGGSGTERCSACDAINEYNTQGNRHKLTPIGYLLVMKCQNHAPGCSYNN